MEGRYPSNHVWNTSLDKNSSMTTMHGTVPIANSECEPSNKCSYGLSQIYSLYTSNDSHFNPYPEKGASVK